MNRPLRRIDGICHWADEELLIRSRGRRLEASRDGGTRFEHVASLPLGRRRDLASRSRLGARLLRATVKHCLRVAEQRLLAFAGTGVYVVDLATGTTRRTATLAGSRPLRVAFDGQLLHYGDYRPNPERSPVFLRQSADLGESWTTVHRFEGIRHVHAMQNDPFDGSLWVTTGDRDEESAIWRQAAPGERFERIHGGTQQCRAIDLLFTPDRVLFGTDAPDERNWIYTLARDGSGCERLHPVAGPVFHARSVGDVHLFSTACEPSRVNSTRRVEVVRYSGDTFTVLTGFAKDRWSMRYFQYGQASFADGPGIGGHVWISPFATAGDQTSVLFETGSTPPSPRPPDPDPTPP